MIKKNDFLRDFMDGENEEITFLFLLFRGI